MKVHSHKLKLNELNTLYRAVVAAGVHPLIEHQGLDHTEYAIKLVLNQEVSINKEILMSALWSAKMLDEEKLLKKITGVTFSELLKKTLPNVNDYYFWEKDKNK